jgi:hypothetical protein
VALVHDEVAILFTTVVVVALVHGEVVVLFYDFVITQGPSHQCPNI